MTHITRLQADGAESLSSVDRAKDLQQASIDALCADLLDSGFREATGFPHLETLRRNTLDANR